MVKLAVRRSLREDQRFRGLKTLIKARAVKIHYNERKSGKRRGGNTVSLKQHPSRQRKTMNINRVKQTPYCECDASKGRSQKR